MYCTYSQGFFCYIRRNFNPGHTYLAVDLIDHSGIDFWTRQGLHCQETSQMCCSIPMRVYLAASPTVSIEAHAKASMHRTALSDPVREASSFRADVTIGAKKQTDTFPACVTETDRLRFAMEA